MLPLTVRQPQPDGHQDGDQDIPTGRGKELLRTILKNNVFNFIDISQ